MIVRGETPVFCAKEVELSMTLSMTPLPSKLSISLCLSVICSMTENHSVTSLLWSISKRFINLTLEAVALPIRIQLSCYYQKLSNF